MEVRQEVCDMVDLVIGDEKVSDEDEDDIMEGLEQDEFQIMEQDEEGLPTTDHYLMRVLSLVQTPEMVEQQLLNCRNILYII